VEVLRVRTGAFGPYANAGVAQRTPTTEMATIARIFVSLPTLELPPFATDTGYSRQSWLVTEQMSSL
jgi:hypothetical protein